jgi:rare lipoprotein A
MKIIILTLLLLTACVEQPSVAPKTLIAQEVVKTKPNTAQIGLASYYTMGKVTANGERYDYNKVSAAHKTLPFNTKVKVTDLSTHKSIVVRINDRGPFIKGRVIDLSLGAAKKLGIIGRGVAKVKVEVVAAR